jgi:acyl carrier protein
MKSDLSAPIAGRPSTASAVRAALAQVLANHGRGSVEISDADTLREKLGLDSLDLALVVVRLEQALGVDPFRRRGGPVRNVGELIAAYERELDERQ